MSEDKTKQDEPVEEPRADEEPDVEAHRFKARSLDPSEEGGDDEEGRRLRRPSGL
jgi:hypothetical protein